MNAAKLVKPRMQPVCQARVEPRPTASPIPRLHFTDDPNTVSSMPPEQAIVECKEESGSGGTSPHRKPSPSAARHG